MKTLCSFSMGNGSEGRTGEVLEQTDRGLFLASNLLYPPGTALVLTVTEPGKRLPVRLRGEVVWARIADRAGMYVRLVSPLTLSEQSESKGVADQPFDSASTARPRSG